MHKQKDGNHAHREKPRNFTHSVQQANIRAVKFYNFDDKIVEQCRPDCKGQWHCSRKDKQKSGWTPPCGKALGLRYGIRGIHKRDLGFLFTLGEQNQLYALQ